MTLQEQTNHYVEYIQAHPIASLEEASFSAIYEDLIYILGQHNKLYYIESDPVISDSQYDELFAYLKNAEDVFPHLVRNDSPTQRLTYQLQENFNQAEHTVPLLSLENSYNAEDLLDRDKSLQNVLKKHQKGGTDDKVITHAGAVLQAEDGSYIFQKRTLDAPINPGKIGLFGGSVEGEESPETCLAREMKEELELTFKKKNIKHLIDIPKRDNPEQFSRVYLISNIDPDTLVLHEGESLVRGSLDVIRGYELTPSTRVAVNYLISHLNEEAIDIHYTCEPKYDGISIELIYKEGIFTQAITRGDGYIGEDITANVKTLLSVPYQIASTQTTRIRGEIVMTKKGFERVNAERQQQGEMLFANPRNATSGSLRQLDTSVTAKRGLICYVYEILSGGDENIKTHQQSLAFLGAQGFLVFPRLKLTTNISEVVEICSAPETKEYFDSETIDFDGIVIKVNEIPLREILGETNHHPRWAMAYKFPAKQVTTTLLSVDRQVGRTGILTPAANLQPVNLGGVTISRASLHNRDFIEDKGILLGDTIWIQRSGEVIPYVIGPVIKARSGDETPVTIPTHCPVCNAEVITSKTDIHVYCPNATCPAQVKGKIEYRVSRDAMNIDGIGESIIDLLVDQGLIKNVADLYTLEDTQKRLQILSMQGFGQRKYQLITEELKKSLNNPLRRVINGLGIQHIGKKTAQIIVEAMIAHGYHEKSEFGLHDIETLLTNEEFLLSIKGIGDETIIALKSRFSNESNKALLTHLESIGINFSIFDVRKKTTTGKLAGISFCITGTFELPRKIIAEVITKHGAVVLENVQKTTNYLIEGQDSSSKVQKAKEYSIPIIEGLEKLQLRFPFLSDDIAPMKLFAAKEKKNNLPRQEGLF